MDSKVRQPPRPRIKSSFAKFDRGGRTNYIEEHIVLDHVEELGPCLFRPLKQSPELTKDLDVAIVFGRKALELCSPEHPHRFASLSNLVVYISTRYDQLGITEDLDEAITLAREALDLSRAMQPNRSQSLNNLAVVLSARYDHLDEIGDLDEAIVLSREALELHSPRYPHRFQSLNNLMVDLSTRYKKLGTMTDLDEIINLDRQILELCPPGHYDRLQSLNNLVVDICTRYEQLEMVTDLDEAISLGIKALEHCSDGHPDRSTYLNNLAFDLFTRYAKHAVGDLDFIIRLDREALELRPPGHPDRFISLNNLSVDLSALYKERGTVAHLDKAIVLEREAFELCPPGHSDRFQSLILLAVDLSARFKLEVDSTLNSMEKLLESGPVLSAEKEVVCKWLDNGTRCNIVVNWKDFKSHLQHWHGITSKSQVNSAIYLSIRPKWPEHHFSSSWGVLDFFEFNRNVIDEKEVICEWVDNEARCDIPVKGKDFKVHLEHRHGITSYLQPYQCRWYACSARPMKKSSLERHMREVHTPVKWACPYCTQTFTRESTLMEHIQRTPGHPQLPVTVSV